METSQSIKDWGRDTFGEAQNIKTYALRAREELDELIAAIDTGESQDAILAEAADVAILLHRLTGALSGELSDAVNDKMRINRKRQWVKSGDGIGQHKPS